MYQQIQGLNTEEKGLEISKIWRWIVQNATLINEFQTFLSDSLFIDFLFFGVKKHTYVIRLQNVGLVENVDRQSYELHTASVN